MICIWSWCAPFCRKPVTMPVRRSVSQIACCWPIIVSVIHYWFSDPIKKSTFYFSWLMFGLLHERKRLLHLFFWRKLVIGLAKMKSEISNNRFPSTDCLQSFIRFFWLRVSKMATRSVVIVFPMSVQTLWLSDLNPASSKTYDVALGFRFLTYRTGGHFRFLWLPSRFWCRSMSS